MPLPDPRRLAALDMYGTRGTARRRRVVLAEFIVGAAGCTALGILGATRGEGIWVALGAWLVGVGTNYMVLTAEALGLSRRRKLEAELDGAPSRRELRAAPKAQLWIAVPLALVAAVVLTAMGRPRTRRAGRPSRRDSSVADVVRP